MIVDEDVHIEHVGVKGMRWGVRSTKSPQARGKQKAKNLRRVHKGMRTVAGALFVASFLAATSPGGSHSGRTSSTRLSDISSRSSSGRQTPQQMHAEQMRLNGAFQIRNQLRNMGADVV